MSTPSRIWGLAVLVIPMLSAGVTEPSYGEISRPPAMTRTVPLIELRQYTLRPGKRDELIDLFENEFIESQEALGMKIVGTFRDLDRSDRFVWIRGFADMTSRAEGLNAFYTGPVWKAHREAANATMIDTDDVLLLRELHGGSGFRLGRSRPKKGSTEVPTGRVIATIYPISAAAGGEFVDFFRIKVEPRLKAAGVKVLASYITETSPNNFPRLPVREKDHVLVWFAAFSSSAECERAFAKLARSAEWSAIREALNSSLVGATVVLRLSPTPRSQLRP